MHRLLKLPLAIVLALCTLPAWGNDQSISDPIAQRWAGLFPDPDLRTQSKQPTPSLYQTSLTVTSFTPPTTSPRLRDLAPETNQARTQGFLSSTTWLNGAFVTETEVAQNQGGAGWLQSRIPGDTSGDASQRMIRLGLTGTAGGSVMEYCLDPPGRHSYKYRTRHGVRCGENGHPAGLRFGARSGNNGII